MGIITACRQSLPGRMNPAGIFYRVIMPLSAVWAPLGLKPRLTRALTAVWHDVTYDIIHANVVLEPQMDW